jgi:hypothetical protein
VNCNAIVARLESSGNNYRIYNGIILALLSIIFMMAQKLHPAHAYEALATICKMTSLLQFTSCFKVIRRYTVPWTDNN